MRRQSTIVGLLVVSALVTALAVTMFSGPSTDRDLVATSSDQATTTALDNGPVPMISGPQQPSGGISSASTSRSITPQTTRTTPTVVMVERASQSTAALEAQVAELERRVARLEQLLANDTTAKRVDSLESLVGTRPPLYRSRTFGVPTLWTEVNSLGSCVDAMRNNWRSDYPPAC